MDLIERLELVVSKLDNITTLPKPYDFFYAVKNEDRNVTWYYERVGLGLTDLKEALDIIKAAKG